MSLSVPAGCYGTTTDPDRWRTDAAHGGLPAAGRCVTAACGSFAATATGRSITAAATNDHHHGRDRSRMSGNGDLHGLRKFLMEVAIDPEKLARYITDPEGTMELATLDEPSRCALRSRSAVAMWDLLLDRPSSTVLDPPPPRFSTETTPRGSLVVVGTGIRTVGQLTLEAITWIKHSDVTLYLVADPIAEEAIRHLNPRGAMSLRGYYGDGINRSQSYEAMIQHILSCIRAGLRTCAAFYGHPGVFAYPSHESIRRARQEGYGARMLPAISAEDCLFADLGVDPAVNGCQSFEATDFLLHNRTVDTSSQLILWQVGVVGDWTYKSNGYDLGAFPLLIGKLCELYGPQHEVYVYEAAILPGLSPAITRIALSSLTAAYVNAGSTLYVPPGRATTLNHEVAVAMGVVR